MRVIYQLRAAEDEETHDTYRVEVRVRDDLNPAWRHAGTLTLTREQWEALRGMLGRFTASVRLDEPTPV